MWRDSININGTTLIGIVLIISLNAAFAISSLWLIRQHDQQLNQLHIEQQKKNTLLQTMQQIIRKRGRLLIKIVEAQDSFIIQNLIEEMNVMGTQFYLARKDLNAKIHNTQEKQVLKALNAPIRYTLNTIDFTLEQVYADDYQTAQKTILFSTLPAQGIITNYLDEFKIIHDLNFKHAIANEEIQKRITRWRIFIAAACLFLIIFLILIKILQRIHWAEQAQNALTDALDDAVISIDQDNIICYMNQRAEQLTGWRGQTARGNPLFDIFHVYPQLPLQQALEKTLNTGKRYLLSVNFEGRKQKSNNPHQNVKTLAVSLSASRHTNTHINGVVLIFNDKSHNESLSQQLFWQTYHDNLTGLVNRHEFERYLEQIVRSAQEDQSTHALAYIDIDQFKMINDSCGYEGGDKLLRQLTHILQTNIISGDLIARLGGDEFGILFHHCNVDIARTRLQEIRKGIQAHSFQCHDQHYDCTASIGLVTIDEHSQNASQVLSAADVACYTAQSEGLGHVVVVQGKEHILEKRYDEVSWVSRITDAIADSRLALYQQNIVPLQKPDLQGHAEILLRMRDQDGRLIPPSLFLPAAERYQLMIKIDKWVIRTAFKTMLHNMQKHYAINLSGQSLGDETFLTFVIKQFNNYPINPKNLCFEITETATIANLDIASHFIASLKQRGCSFSLDDFGTGLSSYAYLKQLPVDFLKIDGSFIRNIVDEPVNQAMVKSINEIAHTLNLETIAEYVEDQATLEYVRNLGVDYAQGYAISQPHPLL